MVRSPESMLSPGEVQCFGNPASGEVKREAECKLLDLQSGGGFPESFPFQPGQIFPPSMLVICAEAHRASELTEYRHNVYSYPQLLNF